MAKQVAALDQAQRKALFDQVQKIVAEQLPMIQFVGAAHLPGDEHARVGRDAGAAPAVDSLESGHAGSEVAGSWQLAAEADGREP